jgi:N-acetylglucosamine-6-phosphate deacetylase
VNGRSTAANRLGTGPLGGVTLAGGRVVIPGGILEQGWIWVSDGRITEIGVGSPPGPAIDCHDRWVVPGFVDLHCHGGGGASFSDAELDQVRTAADLHRRHGSTTMLASLVSAPLPHLVTQLGRLGPLVEEGVLAGVHLEGPFLSPARSGAHDKAALLHPDRAEVDQLLNAGGDTVRMVTLAPELRGAITAIRRLVDSGIVAAIGHTDADLAQVFSAVEAGATVATHLFNGMRPLHHREPGPVGALLNDERVTIELICDLVHLHPATARLAAQHVGAGRTALVTDAISAAGARDGRYELGTVPVTVVDGIATVEDGSLAGSTLTMDVAFRNFVTACGMSVREAVAATATEPAAVLGMSDRVGAIQPGLAADLVVLDPDLRLERVMWAGDWIR